MPKPSRLLDDKSIRHAKPRETLYKLSDGASLRLLIKPDNGKYWRYEYRFAGKQKTLALGVYPSVSLATARSKATGARKLLDEGVDPSEHKKASKAAKLAHDLDINSFKTVALEWYDRKRTGGWSPATARKAEEAIRIDLIPALGSRHVGEIRTSEVVSALQKIEERSPHMAHKAQQFCGAIIRYAITTGKREEGKFLGLRGTLKPLPESHFAKLDETELPSFMKKLEEYGGTDQTRIAIKLLMQTFVRPAELTEAPWHELDLDNALWVITKERMKMRHEHIVPLSEQSVELFRKMHKMTSGYSPYVFPSSISPRTKPMTRDTLSKALRVMGCQGEATPHGFRSFASTLLNGMGYNSDWIERQLAHKEENKTRGTYNHAQHLPERRKMMQDWSDFIDEHAKSTSNVVAGRFSHLNNTSRKLHSR